MAAGFRHLHRVTYAECTVGNHIYYARYLDLLETARGEFLRALGMTFGQWQERGFIFPVIEARLCYRAPARYDDLLSISLQPQPASGVRLNFDYEILNESGTSILQATTHHVCTGLDEKPRRLPGELIAQLQAFLHSATSA